MTTLVTFLGRVPKNQGGYRKTPYTFPDGERTEPVAFLGWPLQRRLAADRLVILGTPGSMWDHLFEGDFDLGDQAEAARLALVAAVEAKQVEDGHLRPLTPLLEAKLGCRVTLSLIPYCRDQAEQVTLLRILAASVKRRDTVHLDVTHGFRHLPMLALLAALYLRQVKEADIAGIWYGAYDPDTGQAPVLDLSGVLRLADWLQAMAVYDRDGDYGVFAPLLGEKGEALAAAAFFERTTNPVKARQTLSGWRDRIQGDPAYDLFRDELHQRLQWWKPTDRAEWEAALARRYLEHRDYLRATVYGLEAAISRRVKRSGGDLNDFDARETVRHEWRQQDADFRLLGDLRNAMAHGVRPSDRRVGSHLVSEAVLAETLRNLFERLLGA